MAQRVQFAITAGPSKWALIINSLGDGQPVTFTAPEFAPAPFEARINSVEREDGSGDSWIITFSVATSKRLASGYYSTRDRTGVFRLS